MQAEDLALRYGDRTLFEHMNFSLAKGDKIALMGDNGVGKSSLLKIIMGLMPPSAGTARRVEGLDVGHFTQKRETLPGDKTPWELIGEGIDFVISNTGDKRHVTSYLESFLFKSEELKRPIHTFSGGEKNRLQLAQFMKHARDLWVFDEPTNDLDLETIGVLEEELRAYQGALVIVSHDRSFIENVTDKCWLIHEGKLEIFEGGWGQAEAFLEAITLEKELAKRAPAAPRAAGIAVESPKGDKLSNKDRNRLEKLSAEMASQEKRVADLEAKLAGDYSLQAELTKAQTKLEGLLEEWMELESRK